MVNCGGVFRGSVEELEVGNRNYWTIEAMARRGGSFVKALAECARRVDLMNLAIIKASWPKYWAEYEAQGREIESKEYPEKA